MTKLTTAQAETLAKIAAGEVSEVCFGTGAWRIWGAPPTVVGRLIQTLGLAAWGKTDGDRRPCLLTDAGRAALGGE